MTKTGEPIHLGRRLGDHLAEIGMTQVQLAARVEGLTQQNLQAMISRNSKTSEHAVAIADALGLSIRWLLTGSGDKRGADWPLSHELLGALRAAGPDTVRRAENAARSVLDMDALPRVGNELAA